MVKYISMTILMLETDMRVRFNPIRTVKYGPLHSTLEFHRLTMKHVRVAGTF
jgi:hypothetical protein